MNSFINLTRLAVLFLVIAGLVDTSPFPGQSTVIAAEPAKVVFKVA